SVFMNLRPETPDPLAAFHPAVQGWFRRAFAAPTPAQVGAWPSIRAGRSTLVAAPTGSGKTLTAFLATLDELLRLGLAGALEDRKSTRLDSSHVKSSYAVFCLKKKMMTRLLCELAPDAGTAEAAP